MCDMCSQGRRHLSKSDLKTKHRVCDFCDTKMSNYKVISLVHYSLNKVSSK